MRSQLQILSLHVEFYVEGTQKEEKNEHAAFGRLSCLKGFFEKKKIENLLRIFRVCFSHALTTINFQLACGILS